MKVIFNYFFNQTDTISDFKKNSDKNEMTHTVLRIINLKE